MESQVSSDFYAARRMIMDKYDVVQNRQQDHKPRREQEEFMLKRIGGHTNIISDDFRVATGEELATLVEVFLDLEHYSLAMSMIEQSPSQWDKSSLSSWIPFVSKKYVDEYEVDMSRSDTKELEQICRDYWEVQMSKWMVAADCYDRIRRHIRARNKLEDMEETAKLMGLSGTNPSDWTEQDRLAFRQWFIQDKSDMVSMQQVRNEENEWRETNHILLSSAYIVKRPPPPPKPVPAFVPVVPMVPRQTHHEFTDPEDWDKAILNQWLQIQCAQLRIDINPMNIPEGLRRLIMIYVRCAWPQDKERLALRGLHSIFQNDTLALTLYQNILDNRPGGLKQQDCNKTESQRHRNRRDLHLWEFLLILLANPQYENESIHWKVQHEGKFELSNRSRVAKMWGLTKGNTKMNYDNMSRSVRQYYKDDDTGIMIRHKSGEPSFGKYSYQFSMLNSEVQKLWKSLSSS